MGYIKYLKLYLTKLRCAKTIIIICVVKQFAIINQTRMIRSIEPQHKKENMNEQTDKVSYTADVKLSKKDKIEDIKKIQNETFKM